jgi:hypothetical protein
MTKILACYDSRTGRTERMVRVGDPAFTLGSLAIGEPGAEDLERCREYGERVADSEVASRGIGDNRASCGRTCQVGTVH